MQVVACDDAEVAQHISDAHIAVPFMAKLDEAVLSCAHQLRMVIQYGVGVETTDTAAVRPSESVDCSLCTCGEGLPIFSISGCMFSAELLWLAS